MADRDWIGTSTPGDLDVAANWTGAAVPTGTDSGNFNAGSQNADPSLGNIASFGTMNILPGYTGTIGGSGNVMTTSLDRVRHEGVAEMWLADSAGTTDDVTIAAVNGGANGTVIHLGGDTMTNVSIARGAVTIDGTMGTIARMAVGYVDNPETDAFVTINAGGVITTYAQRGGVVTSQNVITTAFVHGGTITQTGTTAWTTLYQTAGLVKYQSTGTLTTAIVMGGTLDLRGVTNTITTLVKFPGATVLEVDGLNTITNRFEMLKGQAA